MMTHNETQELWELVKEIPVAMLASVDEDIIRSRPMHLIQNDFFGKMWFFTNKSSHKAKEVDRQPSVNLVFMDVKENRYVSLSGTAKVTQDSELINKFWAPPASVWFPEGKNSDDVALLEIDIEAAEVWDIRTGKITQLLRIAKAKMNKEIPELGEHKQFA